MADAGWKAAILDDALRRAPVILQQHSIKCALAVFRLRERFPRWGPEDAVSLAAVMDEEPVVPAFGGRFGGPLNLERGDGNAGIVAKGLFPVAYVAMRQWVEEASLDGVLEHYRDLACAEPEYLGHNISIFSTFLEARPMVECDADRQSRYLDRFTEFVTTTFHNRQCRVEFPVREGFDGSRSSSEREVLDGCFRQPGYFGHQLLAFTWARRHRSFLGEERYRSVLANIDEVSHWEIPDRNRFTIEPAPGAPTEESLAEAIRGLAFGGPRNIHRVTLAEALVDLWDRADDDEVRPLVLSAAWRFRESPRPA